METKKLLKKYKKVTKDKKAVEKELQENLNELKGIKVKISKKYAKWIEDHGEEIGIPYKEMNTLIKRPTGKIIEASFCDYDDLSFKVKLKNIKDYIYLDLRSMDII